ncbi:unnamed protein product [Polarella glacialis]|uniref:Prolyl 4-hydroxylase alpha subunit domain-containing protein n=1 Tax=Polarella glacialis TaxID=89957 RepID=A0A813J5Z6_POLGL|nr:unnamed protein product [Polarella glacialis]
MMASLGPRGRQLLKGGAVVLAARGPGGPWFRRDSTQQGLPPSGATSSLRKVASFRWSSSPSACDGGGPTTFAGLTRIPVPSSIDGFHEVQLAESSQLYTHNSIILIPNLLSPDECQQLMCAIEQRIQSGSEHGRVHHARDLLQQLSTLDMLRLLAQVVKHRLAAALGGGASGASGDPEAGSVALQQQLSKLLNAEAPTSEVHPCERLQVQHMGPEVRQLSETIRQRLLAFFEGELSEQAEQLFGRRSGLFELTPVFSQNEPALNRYMKGGEFPVHKDGFALTVNVLLSEPGAFSGGGTSFWQQSSSPQLSAMDRHLGKEFVLHPQQGMGVVFNGKLSHAGRPTESGVRHLYVASFNLVSEKT